MDTCQSTHRERRNPSRCLTCGNPTKEANRTYCSYACSGKSRQRRVYKVCVACGKAFWRWQYKVGIDSMKWCSILCKNRSPEMRHAASQSKLGDLNPMRRPEVARKMSCTLRERHSRMFSERMKETWKTGKIKPRHVSIAERESASIRMKQNNPMHQPSVVMKVSLALKQKFKDPVYRIRQLTKQRTTPNKLEIKMVQTLRELGLSNFKYTGNRSFWIGPCASGLCRNPDFTDSLNKRVILVSAHHWHTEVDMDQQIKDYASRGWKASVVWSNKNNELDASELMKEVANFALA